MAVESIVAEPTRDDRPIVYNEGQRRVYRASALGSCLRALVAAGLGMTPSEPHEFMTRAAEFGARHEAGILEWLQRHKGFRIVEQQVPVELVVGNRYVLRGHVDAIAEVPLYNGEVTKVLVEIKTASADRAERIVKAIRECLFAEVEPKYAFQVSTYMLRLKLPAVYVVWPKMRQNGTDALGPSPYIEPISKPPLGWTDILKRIDEAERWIAKGEFPSCDRSDKSYFCSHRYLCEQPACELAPTDRAAEIDAWAAAYSAAKAQRDQADGLMKQAREKLLELAEGDKRMETARYRVTVSRYNRTSYDTKGMESDPQLAPLIAPYRRETPVETVRVTEKGDG